jgi:hypothetical protein
VVLGHRVVVHVRDHHPLGLAGAGGVVLTGALYLKFKQNVKRCVMLVEVDLTSSRTRTERCKIVNFEEKIYYKSGAV